MIAKFRVGPKWYLFYFRKALFFLSEKLPYAYGINPPPASAKGERKKFSQASEIRDLVFARM